MSIDRRRADPNDLAALLISGGDSRLRLDRETGLNRYFCGPRPAGDVTCFASCTASPISEQGWWVAEAALARLRRTATSALEPDALRFEATEVAWQLGNMLGTTDLAKVYLTPSGTDATMLAISLLAAERPGKAILSILCSAAETGAGVPLAAAGRHFGDIAGGMGRVATGELLRGLPQGMKTAHVALRDAEGQVRDAAAIDADFERLAATPDIRPVIHLVEGSKTELRAPRVVPPGVDVIVDACQGRIASSMIRNHLLNGRPVLLTGSKFYGGPSFCGALLFPMQRLSAINLRALPSGLEEYFSNVKSPQPAANPGTILRWTVALSEMRRFTTLYQKDCQARISSLSERVSSWIASVPGLTPVSMPGPSSDPDAWPRSIHTFAVRDPAEPDRLLGMDELRALYAALAGDRLLVGQPVAIGQTHGGLRVAIGAASLGDPQIEANLQRLFSTIERRTRLQ